MIFLPCFHEHNHTSASSAISFDILPDLCQYRSTGHANKRDRKTEALNTGSEVNLAFDILFPILKQNYIVKENILYLN